MDWHVEQICVTLTYRFEIWSNFHIHEKNFIYLFFAFSFELVLFTWGEKKKKKEKPPRYSSS